MPCTLWTQLAGLNTSKIHHFVHLNKERKLSYLRLSQDCWEANEHFWRWNTLSWKLQEPTELNNNCACVRFWTIERAFKTNMAARSSVLWTAFFRFGKVLVRWTTIEGSCLVLSLSSVLNARMKFMLMIVKARLKGEWIREICSKSIIFLQVPEHRLRKLR